MEAMSLQHYSLDEYFKIPDLFSRQDWGARKPKSKLKADSPVIYLVIKRTDTESCYNKEDCMKIIREIQRKDMDEDKLPDIRYNFLIGGDGTMYEGRGWGVAPEPFPVNKRDFTSHMNTTSVLIGLIGDFEEKRPPQRQELSVLHLVGEGVEKNQLHENAQFVEYEEVSNKRDPYDED